MEGVHAALELARTDAHKGDAVTVVLVHVGLNLKDKAGEVVGRRVHGLARKGVLVGQRRRCQAQELLQEGLHTKVGERRAKEGRAKLAAGHGVKIQLIARTVKQLDIVHQVAMVLFANELVELGIAQLGLDFGDLLGGVGVAIALKGDHVARLSIKDATEVAARANRPVHGIRVDAQDILDLFHKLKGIASLAVELVHKGEDGNVAQGANAGTA